MAVTQRRWALEEIELLQEHYQTLGARGTLAKLWAAGFNDRNLNALVQRASRLGVATQRYHTWAEQPDTPRSIGRQLFDLAESNPNPAEYERRKAEILKGG